MDGAAVTVTVNGTATPGQPVTVFVTVIVPLYVANAAPAGTVKTIGVAGSAVLGTFANPAAMAAALYVILYWLGAPVVAVYGRFAVVVPLQTDGLAPSVIVGAAVTVTVNGTPALEQPAALFFTVSVAV